MSIQTKTEIIKLMKIRYNLNFTAVRGKRVFFETAMNDQKHILICTPHSIIHEGGQGWIDLTKIQIDLMKKYEAALFAFRLSTRKNYYIDFQKVEPLLTEECTFVSKREGVHCKLYVWPEKIEVRQNKIGLPIKPNIFENIDNIFRYKSEDNTIYS